MKNQLLVAVWMVTYNHEKYIANAVESVMMQKTTFNYKLFIGEDYSKDKTREICNLLKEKYPNNIELVLHEFNVGAAKNAMNMYRICSNSNAKYIALCEGDDYWTDPLKLQKQVDFLEKNEDFSICAHAVKKIDEKNAELGIFSKPGIYSRFQFLKNYSISTLSAVYRNMDIDYSFLQIFPTGDFPLFMMLLENHMAYVMPEIMGVHRTHEGGIWSMKGQIYQAEIAIKNFESMQENLKLSDDEAQFITNKLKEFKEILSYYKNPLTGFIKGEISYKFFKGEVTNKFKKWFSDNFIAKK